MAKNIYKGTTCHMNQIITSKNKGAKMSTKQSIFEQAVLKHLEEHCSGCLTPESDFYFACLEAIGEPDARFAKARVKIRRRLNIMVKKDLIEVSAAGLGLGGFSDFGARWLNTWCLPDKPAVPLQQQ